MTKSKSSASSIVVPLILGIQLMNGALFLNDTSFSLSCTAVISDTR